MYDKDYDIFKKAKEMVDKCNINIEDYDDNIILPEGCKCICELSEEEYNKYIDDDFEYGVIGHINEAGGYCCPHHGNTCGYDHWWENEDEDED